jgi:CheY-like chemotaxis protein
MQGVGGLKEDRTKVAEWGSVCYTEGQAAWRGYLITGHRESHTGEPVMTQKPRVMIIEDDPDMIDLLSLMMEDLNGWKVLETVKTDKDLNRIPVLIISARHHLEDPETTAAHEGLFEGYLVKPFVVRDLLTAILEALE